MNRCRRVNTVEKFFRNAFITILLLLSIVLWASMAGCGKDNDSASPSGAAPVVRACKLLTPAEVEAVIGAPVAEPRRTHDTADPSKPWLSMCNYYAEQKQTGLGVSIMPHGRNATGRKAFAMYEADLKKGLGDGFSLESEEGIGDYAGWDKSTKQLTVFTGPYMVIVGLISPNLHGDEALQLNRRIAEICLKKL